MTGFDWLNSPWASLWTAALLHFLWQGALLTAIGALALQFRKSTTRYALLVAVFVAMTACPPATLAWLMQSQSPGEVAVTEPLEESAGDAFALADSEQASYGPLADAGETILEPSGAIWNVSTLATSWTWMQPALFALWTMGTALFLLRLLIGFCGLAGWMRTARTAPETWLQLGESFRQRLGLKYPIRILLSEHISEPLALWWWRPVILLPAAWLAEAPPDVLESVLAHELVHLRRWDLWINFYQRLSETVLFYHPGVWWLSRRIRLERELCCDAAAVALVGKPVRYARALEFVARQRLEQVRPLLAAGMGGTEMTLLGRIQRVLGIESPRRFSGGWSLGLACAAILLAGGVMLAISSRDVVGDDAIDPVTGAIIAQADEDDPPRRPDGPQDGDRPRSPEEDRPPRDAGPPERGPREDGPPRRRGGPGDGDRGPRRGPPEGFGDRGGPPPGGDILRQLMQEIRGLRNEVAQLRQEVRALRGGPGGPEREFRGSPERREDGRPPRDGDVGPGRRGPPEGRRGPPRDSERPPRDGERGGPEGRGDPPPYLPRQSRLRPQGDPPPRRDGDGERPQRPPAEDDGRDV